MASFDDLLLAVDAYVHVASKLSNLPKPNHTRVEAPPLPAAIGVNEGIARPMHVDTINADTCKLTGLDVLNRVIEHTACVFKIASEGLTVKSIPNATSLPLKPSAKEGDASSKHDIAVAGVIYETKQTKSRNGGERESRISRHTLSSSHVDCSIMLYVETL
jgi:hypothetical protein